MFPAASGLPSVNGNVPAHSGEVALLVQHARRRQGHRRSDAGQTYKIAGRLFVFCRVTKEMFENDRELCAVNTIYVGIQ